MPNNCQPNYPPDFSGMGTKVHCESYLRVFCSMRDLNKDSSSSSWPLFYGDKLTPIFHYNNGYMQRTSADGHPEHERDALKQKMLEHEAIFKNQVCELHRLYQIQRNMMEEAKQKQVHSFRPSMEPTSSSCLQGPQVPSEATKWHMAGFPLMNTFNRRTSGSGVENTNSPVSYTWGYRAELNQFPLQNGSISKESVALDGRPLKVRKKFDLQLPADDCIDVEEVKYKENMGPASGTKLFLDGCAGVKADCGRDASASCLRVSNEFVDLNEPIQVEETTAASSVNFLHLTPGNGENEGLNQPTKSKAASFDVNGFHLSNGFSINSSVDSEVHNRGRLAHTYDAGSRSIASSPMQSNQPDRSPMMSNLRHGMLSPIHKPPVIHPNPYSKEEDRWREGLRCGLGPSHRDHDRSNNSQLQYIASNTPSSFPLFSASAGSRVPSVPSWAKPLGDFGQKISTFETNLSSAAAVSAQSQEHVVRKSFVNSSSWWNPALQGESTANGFYQGSASASKQPRLNLLPSGFGSSDCSKFDNVSCQRSSNLGIDIPKGSPNQSSKYPIVIDLNEELPTSPSDEVIILEDLNVKMGKREPEDLVPAFPWLNKPKVEPMNEAAYPSKFCWMNETGRDLNQMPTPATILTSSNNSKLTRGKEIAEAKTVNKMLGFPIFDRRAQGELSSAVSTSVVNDWNPEGLSANCTKKRGMIDINAACQPDEEIAAEHTEEKKKQKKDAFISDYIDLNAFASDCEDNAAPCDERQSASTKRTLEIDLEVPVLQEHEEDNVLPKESKQDDLPMPSHENRNEQMQDEVLRDAAEIMVVISSSCPQMPINADNCHASGAYFAESLVLFADAVLLSVCEDGNESKPSKDSRPRDESMQKHSTKEMDEFEAMTLQLEAVKEDDYMPNRILLNFQNVEESGTNGLTNRPRRGQSRRGRQRRDFQRDILPGLTSLSRHEVSEDLQIFGGIMRAMGHSWNSGLTRRNGSRNGGGRGRKRSVVEIVPPPAARPICTSFMRQISNTSLEDRSLTGWGKTTRRPRRQRFPAGNPPPVVLS